jgi:uroporphyrinogen-III synthase
MAFGGMRVLALESRRAVEMGELIRRQDGEPFVAPSMREIPIEEHAEAFHFADRLFAGDFDLMILLTGIGTRQLNRTLAARYGESAFPEALRKIAVLVRGPKPAAALREMAIAPTAIAPEPNTWRELLPLVDSRSERRIAVQEYGRPNTDLIAALRDRGAEVATVRIYQYGLPEDIEPLREAARRLAAGQFDAALFTTAMQMVNLSQVARDLGIEQDVLAGLRRCLVGSIGPTTTEALEEFDVRPALEPSHPKMGILVKETAERAGG